MLRRQTSKNNRKAQTTLQFRHVANQDAVRLSYLVYRIIPRIRNVSYPISIARAFKIYTMGYLYGCKILVPLRFLYTDTFLIWVLSCSRNYTVYTTLGINSKRITLPFFNTPSKVVQYKAFWRVPVLVHP